MATKKQATAAPAEADDDLDDILDDALEDFKKSPAATKSESKGSDPAASARSWSKDFLEGKLFHYCFFVFLVAHPASFCC